MYIFWLLFILLLLYSALWYHFKKTTWCRSQTCLIGKTAIVTGANTGIGFETALDFARRGARVILACRNKYYAEYAKKKIIEATGNTNICVKIVEFVSLSSVRDFAEDINKTEERLDILVNNVKVMGVGNHETEDGLLSIMQVNYFSSFLLTNLLIGLLKKSGPSRIINISSKVAQCAKFDIDNLNKSTTHFNNYSCSKVCNILFTMELAEKLKDTKVSTFSLHPGTVESHILEYVSDYSINIFYLLSFLCVWKTSEEGAQTTIYTSVQKGIEKYSGQHFDECKCVEPYRTVREVDLGKKLWELSKKIVDLKPEEGYL